MHIEEEAESEIDFFFFSVSKNNNIVLNLLACVNKKKKNV